MKSPPVETPTTSSSWSKLSIRSPSRMPAFFKYALSTMISCSPGVSLPCAMLLGPPAPPSTS